MRIWAVLTWLLAGPLNFSALIWIALGETVPFGLSLQNVASLICIPSSLGAAHLLATLETQSHTNVRILLAAIGALLFVVVLILVPTFVGFLLVMPPAAPAALLVGAQSAVVYGLPSALSAALIVRLVLFKWRRSIETSETLQSRAS